MMVFESSLKTPVKNRMEDLHSEARLNVLYSPFRKREVNPQDWESKMSFWKDCITHWCLEDNSSVFTLAKLQSTFIRNGRSASCLTTVLEEMIRTNDIILVQELLSQDPTSQSWSNWAVNVFIKTPVIWSFTKLKESLVSKSDFDVNEEFVHITVLKKHEDQLKAHCERINKWILGIEEVKDVLGVKDDHIIKVILHWLQLQGKVSLMTVFNRSIIKVASGSGRVSSLTEADVGLYHLQLNEQALRHTLETLEEEKQKVEEEARGYLRKGMRQTAKSCLRKKKELEKCIDKRAAALDNVQVLLTRVKDAESDKEILESYQMGLSALKATFKNAGISEEGVGQTMDQVKEVLEIHEEIQSAMSEPMAAGTDADLEEELADLLATYKAEPVQTPHDNIWDKSYSDLPEVPTHSPSTFDITKTKKIAQSLAH